MVKQYTVSIQIGHQDSNHVARYVKAILPALILMRGDQISPLPRFLSFLHAKTFLSVLHSELGKKDVFIVMLEYGEFAIHCDLIKRCRSLLAMGQYFVGQSAGKMKISSFGFRSILKIVS